MSIVSDSKLYHKKVMRECKVIGRVDFFNDYWKSIRDEGWNAVVLHSWRNLPERIESDVDYAVSGASPRELIAFLAAFCHERDWRLANVIEHEPGAFFCVCMQRGGGNEVLALDVAWDYRRLGHLLIPSELLQRNSRNIPGKSFRVPAAGTEAAYMVAKAAAKGKEFDKVRTRLIELFEEDFGECLKSFQELFQFDGCGCKSPEEAVQAIEDWFPNAVCFGTLRSGRRFGFQEIALYVRRLYQPTGAWITVSGCETQADLLKTILEPFLPLFRHVHGPKRIRFWQYVRTHMKVIRTSLVIDKSGRRVKSTYGRRFVVDLSHVSDPFEERCRFLDWFAQRVENRFIARKR